MGTIARAHRRRGLGDDCSVRPVASSNRGRDARLVAYPLLRPPRSPGADPLLARTPALQRQGRHGWLTTGPLHVAGTPAVDFFRRPPWR